MRSTPVGGQCALGHPGPDLRAGKLSEFVKAPETCWAPAFTWTSFCIAGVLSLPGRARPAFRPELSLKKARDQGVGHTASLGGDLTASGGRRERRRPYRSSPGTAEKMRRPRPQCPRSWDPGGGGGVFWDELPRLQRSPGAGEQQEARWALVGCRVRRGSPRDCPRPQLAPRATTGMCCVLCQAFSFVRPSFSLQGGPGRRGTRRSWKRALCPRRCGKGPGLSPSREVCSLGKLVNILIRRHVLS